MDTNRRNEHDESAKRYLGEVADRYIFDASSGIYKPRSEPTESDARAYSRGSDKKRPFWVGLIRDWPAFLVSMGTLLLLIVTVFYAHKQWHESHDATKATQQAAYAACVSAQIARSTLLVVQAGGNDSHNLAIGSLTQAAAVTWAEAAQIKISPKAGTEKIGDSFLPWRPISIQLVYQNIGKSAAHDLKIQTVVRLVDAGKEPDFNYPRHPMNRIFAGNVFPDVPVEVPVNRTTPGKPPMDNEDQAMTTEEFAKYTAGKLYISDYSRGTYTDIFGVQHWIQFCETIWPSFHVGEHRQPKCAAYNSSDSESLDRKGTSKAILAIPSEIVCTKPPN